VSRCLLPMAADLGLEALPLAALPGGSLAPVEDEPDTEDDAKRDQNENYP